jgi:2-oxo-4-hydroxy-4-carboxy-5-ureidoimidazoline decarboxylase
MTLDEANSLPADTFTARFGGVFEHSPWVAERVAALRPFPSVDAMHAAMCAEVEAAGEGAQLALLRAHPELAGKAAIAGDLTADSLREQSGAGLDRCTPAEYAELQVLNGAYRERFGFPFIVAVRGLDRAAILAALRARVRHERATEFAEARRQVERIAALRLASLMESNA